MSIEIMTLVFKHSKTRNVARLILLSLADNANDNGACWPSHAEIARKSGVSIPTVKLYMKIFVEIGLVVKETRVNRDGLRTSNMYYIVTDRIGDDVIDPRMIKKSRPESQRNRTLDKGLTHPLDKGLTHPLDKGLTHPLDKGLTQEPSINHQDRNRQGSEDAAKPRAPARPPAKPSDDESKHPAIKAVRQVTNRYPHRTLFASIITALGEAPNIELMRACFTEWVARGFNANSFKWLEWYTAGAIPPQHQPQAKSRQAQVIEGFARLAKEAEEEERRNANGI